MLNAKAFAHAATVVTAVFYVACLVLSYAASDLIFSIGNSWLHSVNLESIKSTKAITIETALLGLITISLLTWVTTYATITLYNKWAKK